MLSARRLAALFLFLFSAKWKVCVLCAGPALTEPFSPVPSCAEGCGGYGCGPGATVLSPAPGPDWAHAETPRPESCKERSLEQMRGEVNRAACPSMRTQRAEAVRHRSPAQPRLSRFASNTQQKPKPTLASSPAWSLCHQSHDSNSSEVTGHPGSALAHKCWATWGTPCSEQARPAVETFDPNRSRSPGSDANLPARASEALPAKP